MRLLFFCVLILDVTKAAPIIPQTVAGCQGQIFKFEGVGGGASLKTTPCAASPRL